MGGTREPAGTAQQAHPAAHQQCCRNCAIKHRGSMAAAQQPVQQWGSDNNSLKNSIPRTCNVLGLRLDAVLPHADSLVVCTGTNWQAVQAEPGASAVGRAGHIALLRGAPHLRRRAGG